MFFLENCRFHIILIGISLSPIVKKLDKHVNIHHEIDSLYTLFKHRFNLTIVTSNGEILNQLSRAIQHNLQWKRFEKMPSIAKKRLISKKSRDLYCVLIRNWLPHKLLAQHFWIEFEKIKTQSGILICSR